MGKVLKVLGVIFLIFIVGFVALLFWAHGEGAEQNKKFFDAVASEDPTQFIALMDDSLASQLDPPVIRMWMEYVNKRLGKWQGLAASEFSTEKKMVDAGTMVETKGAAKFEKGQADVRLTVLNDKIVGYEVYSEALKGDWLTIPKEDLYRDRAKKLIEHFVILEIDEAREMMHEALRKQLSKEDTTAGMELFARKYGPLKSIEIVDEKFINGESDKSLLIRMLCTFDNGKTYATVRFDFDSTRGHLLSFQLPAD